MSELRPVIPPQGEKKGNKKCFSVLLEEGRVVEKNNRMCLFFCSIDVTSVTESDFTPYAIAFHLVACAIMHP